MRKKSASGIFLLRYCCSPADYAESDCKEGPVWKARCRPQEVWAKFLGHMTTCQFSSIASLRFVFCIGFCHIFFAVSPLTDSGQRLHPFTGQAASVKGLNVKYRAHLLLCLFVLLSVALK